MYRRVKCKRATESLPLPKDNSNMTQTDKKVVPKQLPTALKHPYYNTFIYSQKTIPFLKCMSFMNGFILTNLILIKP